MTEKFSFLVKVPLFSGLTERQLKRLATRFIEREYKAGETIVTQGKGGVGLFIITSGKAEALVEAPDGTKTVVNTFGPTDFFGEIALLDDGPRTASVVAVEDTCCLVLSRDDFIAVLKNDADMGVVVSQELARRFRRFLSMA
jgi:CRP/FNR family cyclic AMP-dependent transcriptional regulator